MKRVSAKLFFSVVWKGIKQVVSWFFGLFGYKREGKFAKCVWGLFAISATIITMFVAGALIWNFYNELCWKMHYSHCSDRDCYRNGKFLSEDIAMYHPCGHKGWIKNVRTGKKTITGIDWICKPIGENDSLAVFCKDDKRGFFNIYTGEIELPATYDHAWTFSDGIASVENNGIIRFIDTKGKQVFDRTITYAPNYGGYVFHRGYCIVDENHDDKFGLIDTLGRTALDEEYDRILISNSQNCWVIKKGNQSGILDNDLNPILPLTECDIILWYDGIDVTMGDNTMRKYDLDGNLIDDFYISGFEYLEYETEEVEDIMKKDEDSYGYHHEYVYETRHKTARAKLGKYSTCTGNEGLMTTDGTIVTFPKYEDIKAIGPDTYICTVSHGDKEIVNGKGEKIKSVLD